MKIGVIGTAGRNDDKDKLNAETWRHMLEDLVGIINLLPELNKAQETIDLVSGGAAWADHMAVHLFLYQSLFGLKNQISSLTLHLPAKFEGSYLNNQNNSAARVANYYHKCFSNCIGVDSLNELQLATKYPNCTTTVSNGFHARNLLVGQVDVLVAYTFGTRDSVNKSDLKPSGSGVAGLKPGGTAHCWDNSKAGIKIHRSLGSL
jgi:hypothetical protein